VRTEVCIVAPTNGYTWGCYCTTRPVRLGSAGSVACRRRPVCGILPAADHWRWRGDWRPAGATGRDPHEPQMDDRVGELATRSDEFRRRWSSHEAPMPSTTPQSAISNSPTKSVDMLSRWPMTLP